MKRKTDPGRLLDRAVGEVRDTVVPPEQVEEAAARVRHYLQAEHNKVVPHPAAEASVDRIQSCADFRSLIPAYLTGSLTASRKLLFEDHVRECVGCRKALETERRGAGAGSVRRGPAGRRIQGKHLRWVAPIAAAAVIAAALQTGPVRDWLWPIDVHAVVQMVDGGLSSVSGQEIRPIAAGQRIERDQAVRTGADSGAVLELPDGTRVEMASRSELSLGRARDGVKIELARGNVIVSAAKQHGHLYVETGDFSVAVVGTVFAVSSGIKGSRVSVIEGQVQVQQAGLERAVLPGQQVFTDPAMGAVPIEEEIAWSRNAEELLKELVAFGRDFAGRTENAAMRYSSNLAPLVPADTLVLASLPNISQPFSESYALFRQRMGENSTLADWWREANQPASGLGMDELAGHFSAVGAYLGQEVILAFPKEMEGRGPLFLAETATPESLIPSLEAAIRRFAQTGEGSSVRLARNEEELAALSGDGLAIYVGDGLMIASDAGQVQRTAAIRRGTLANDFAGTSLYQRLDQAYREGVGWLLAVDLQQVVGPGDGEIEQLGFRNVRQLVLEQKTGLGSAASLVTLGFTGQRQGLAAWLAAPAPMGALEFVSADAYGFSSWVVKDPELILDDFLGLMQGNAGTDDALRRFQETHGVDLRRDLAEPLGNEVLLAIDGPVLPTTSWKVVLEVDDAPRLENAIQWAVTNVNRELELQQRPKLSLASETVEGRTYYALTGAPVEIHYTWWVGYMIIAPSRALLMEAIRVHDSGTSIARSETFRRYLPADGRDTASGIMYQNIAAMTRGLPDTATTAISPQLQNDLRQAALLEAAMPKVALMYGEQDRITGAAKGSFGIQLAGMLGIRGMMSAAGIEGFLH